MNSNRCRKVKVKTIENNFKNKEINKYINLLLKRFPSTLSKNSKYRKVRQNQNIVANWNVAKQLLILDDCLILNLNELYD